MSTTTDPLASRYAFDDNDMGIYGLDHPHARPRPSRTNVGGMERIASGIVGGLFALSGISLLARGHTLTGGVFSAAGAAMALRSATGYCPMYDRAGVSDADDELDDRAPWTRTLELEKSIAIHRPASELYTFWRALDNLPQIMDYLERVDVIDDRHSVWTAKGPRDTPLTWNAVITSDVPNQHIAWTSTEDSQFPNTGSVQFVPIRESDTLVRVALRYDPPAGALGALAATLFGKSPAKVLEKDLKRFKATMEAGEAITTEGQPRGACS